MSQYVCIKEPISWVFFPLDQPRYVNVPPARLKDSNFSEGATILRTLQALLGFKDRELRLKGLVLGHDIEFKYFD